MAFTNFTAGTVISSTWLNDVNQAVYNTLPGKISGISPVLVTPNIGNATATTVNGITFTQSTGTLTIPNGTTATVSGVNTGDQNLTNYAQFNGNNTWTATQNFVAGVTIPGTCSVTTTNTDILYQKAIGTSGSGTVTFNTSTASTFGHTFTGNSSIVFAGTPITNRDQTIYLKLVNGGAYTVTFPAGTLYPSGTAPTLTASGADLLSAWYDPFAGKWVVGMVWKDYK